MNTKPKLLQLFLGLILSSGFATFLVSSVPATPLAYVEPGLRTRQSETLSVIVTAADSQLAAQTVERLGGQVNSDLWLIDAVAATIPTDQLNTLAADPAIVSIVADKEVKSAQSPDGWVTDFRFPVPFDNRPDAQELAGPYWKLANPVAIDVGADVLHWDYGITGKGITAAVVDSGITFDGKTRTALGLKLDKLFLGQADFVGGGMCAGKGKQETGHCFTKKGEDSRDGYGHGSHVAGLIWNNFIDVNTSVSAGIAPEANILSVRVLDKNGIGTYTDVIEGIQYVVSKKNTYGIRILNLSISAYATTPYFVDPLNRAAEQAWANGIVVLAAAGNTGPKAESITVPGNDPYVITVGAINNQRTPGYWADDIIPAWSATGPTLDGFTKPDVLAPGTYLVSFMYRDLQNMANSDTLVQQHPDNVIASSLFRMSGTSQATAVTSGVVALMLQANPGLTPDQVKYRLLDSSLAAFSSDDDLVYNALQQGMGRVWAPGAVMGSFPVNSQANQGMNVNTDLAHGTGWVDSNGDGWVQQAELDPTEMAYHYNGRIDRLTSDDGQAYLYYLSGGVDPLTMADEFYAIAYNGSSGSQSWAGSWIESGDNGNPASGNIRVLSSSRCASGYCVEFLGQSNDWITRAANLAGATQATLTYQWGIYQREDAVLRVQVRPQGSTNWTTIKTHTQYSGSGQETIDITSFVSPATEIRFGIQTSYYSGTRFSIDSVRVDYSDSDTNTYTAHVDQDSWLKQAGPGENNGTVSELLTNNKSGDATRLVSRFNLANIPPGSTIVSAKAYFWVSQASSAAVNVHRITDAWTESGVTWSNTHTDFDPVADATFTPGTNDQYVQVDLKNLVQEWVNGAPNYGLMFNGTANDSESKYYGKDQGGSSQDPYLEIVAVEPVVLGAAWSNTMEWLDQTTLASANLTWVQGQMSYNNGLAWSGGEVVGERSHAGRNLLLERWQLLGQWPYAGWNL
ncbi:MAG: S8 family peptidase [Anaerolineales bacterium]|nr:S8 family peptidase [Anaerolineales bacterium]